MLRLVVGDPLSDDDVVKEVLAVAKTVVPFSVVPGVSAGLGTAAYAGIPVGSVRTEADLRDVRTVDFDALADSLGTLVVTVDSGEVATVAEQLVASGRKPDTPVAVSCNGTTTGQQTVVSQLASSSWPPSA